MPRRKTREMVNNPLMPHHTQKTEEEYINAIQNSGGNISTVARILNVARNTAYSKLKSNPHLMQLLNQVREEKTDKCEELIKSIVDDENEDMKLRFEAAKFWLTNMGKMRGWGVQTSMNINASLNMDIDFDTTKYSIDEKRNLLETLARGMKTEGEENDNIIDGEWTDSK
jgi:hypothetical protein